jgi:glycosyltransferase involved in cell wall biosynthesis
MNKYAKVLIVGTNFNRITGGGITLSNLFKGWDKNSIAVVSNLIDYNGNEICEKYYQIGNLENKRPFPFNFIRLKVKSGGRIIKQNNNDNSQTNKKKKTSVIKNIYLILNRFTVTILNFLGLSNYFYKWEVSDDLIKWIKEFNPDIIYTQLSKLVLIRFVQDIYDKLKIPIAIHIMDDWPQTINSGSLFSSYWRKVIDKEFRHLLDDAKILLSISEAMSEEYKKRYGKEFIPFHNPIETDKWIEASKQNWAVNKTFTLLYAGRIGTANSQSISDISEAIQNLKNVGYDIKFEVYTSDHKNKTAKRIMNFQGVSINNPIPYCQMPKLLASCDTLVLPLDFSKKGIKFAGLSIPTKVTEYMASGTPILIYAPSETALNQFAKTYKIAKVVSKRDINKICNAIKELFQSESQRKEISRTARNLVIEKNDAIKVREKFRQVLNNKNEIVSYI